ncbi:hypothetical protein LINGRAHAP2_LOCUS419, partial [Linum grandiflorum]
KKVKKSIPSQSSRLLFCPFGILKYSSPLSPLLFISLLSKGPPSSAFSLPPVPVWWPAAAPTIFFDLLLLALFLFMYFPFQEGYP